MKDVENIFIEKLHECNQHKKRLLLSKKKLEHKIPLTKRKYELLTDEEISFIDQMIFRFSKLQDTMGEKLFPSFLELVGEKIRDKTFIDRLNRLEELNIVNKNEWMQLRKDRNEIAHEYSFNKNEVIDSINLIYEVANNLLNIYDTFYKYCFDKFDFIKNSDILTNS